MTSPCSVCGAEAGAEHSEPLVELVNERNARFGSRVERERGRRLIKVIRLAPDIETAEALLRGQRVPLSRLDPVWAERYGVRNVE